jgi:hypothetical protein
MCTHFITVNYACSKALVYRRCNRHRPLVTWRSDYVARQERITHELSGERYRLHPILFGECMHINYTPVNHLSWPVRKTYPRVQKPASKKIWGWNTQAPETCAWYTCTTVHIYHTIFMACGTLMCLLFLPCNFWKKLLNCPGFSGRKYFEHCVAKPISSSANHQRFRNSSSVTCVVADTLK